MLNNFNGFWSLHAMLASKLHTTQDEFAFCSGQQLGQLSKIKRKRHKTFTQTPPSTIKLLPIKFINIQLHLTGKFPKKRVH